MKSCWCSTACATVRDIDTRNDTMTVEAGMTLRAVQEQAAAVDRLFPLSLASEGSCRIGGVLSTNAGGLAVLAYGNARNLCLGLEVVLADGRIWSGLNRLRKDNTGYDLKQLFIGSEGTLGIITAAVLRLYPAIRDRATAFVAVASPAAALDLLGLARDRAASTLTTFEPMPRLGLDFTIAHAGAAIRCETRRRGMITRPAVDRAAMTAGLPAIAREVPVERIGTECCDAGVGTTTSKHSPRATGRPAAPFPRAADGSATR